MKKCFLGKIKIPLLIFFVMSCTLLSSCGAGKVDVGYLYAPFVCELEWESGGQTFKASAELLGISEKGERDAVLRFSHPCELVGMTVRRVSGEYALNYYDTKLSDASSESYAELLDMLTPPSALSFREKHTENGNELFAFEGDSSIWYFSETGSLLRIERGERVLNILKTEEK